MEVLSDVGHQLLVRRMVDRLDPDDLFLQAVMMLVNVLDESKLGRAWTNDEYVARRRDGQGDLMVELLRRGWVAVNEMGRGLDERFVEAFRIDVEDLGLMVVNPNGGVKGCHAHTIATTVPMKRVRAVVCSRGFIGHEQQTVRSSAWYARHAMGSRYAYPRGGRPTGCRRGERCGTRSDSPSQLAVSSHAARAARSVRPR